MLGKIFRFIRSGDASLAQQHPLLARVIATVGTDIGEARDFARLAIPALETAVSYFDRQIAAIPGPFPLSVRHFPARAGIAAHFPESEDIGRALGRSLATKEALPELLRSGHDEIYALLGMRTRAGNGSATVFADHSLHSLAPTATDARNALRQAAFERLLRNFAEHVEKLRRHERLLKIDWEWNLRHDIAKTGESGGNPEFVYANQELTPDNLLRALISWLEKPERFFRLEAGESPVAENLPNGSSAQAPLDLPLLHCSDRRQWLSCLVQFSTDEASQALEQETHTHRYIFI